MQQFLTVILIFLQISNLTWADDSNTSTQPYCFRNKTELSYKLVTKTRVKTVPKKGFFKKLTFQKETQTEIYEDEEPVYKIKPERYCCDGYKMSDLELCEPQCVKNGCPEHSRCVEPEVCECKKGYFSTRSPKDNKHYCEPICEQTCPEESICVAPNECACKTGYRWKEGNICEPHCLTGCPHNGTCVAPNVCECQEGYKSEYMSCIPICSLGDKCKNGKCVDKDICKCNIGYFLNADTNNCESTLSKLEGTFEDDEDITLPPYRDQETTVSVEQPKIALETETDIDSVIDGVDPNEVFEEIIDSTTYSSTEFDSNQKCPEDYVFHGGECKPLKFATLEIDCRFKPCDDPRAICQENGTCSCTEGYKWFRTHVVTETNQSVKPMCLSLADYQSKLLQLQDDTQKTEVQESSNWVTIFFIVLGILIMTCALLYLGFRVVRSQRGELDMEAKNLSCAYENRAGAEKSVVL